MNEAELYLITDRRAVPAGELLRRIEAALLAGVRMVQLREKDLPDEELLELARSLRVITTRHDARLLINSRIDIALACSADGVHLGMTSPGREQARERLGPDRLIGFSTHNDTEIAIAEKAGADFITFGPVYATPSKLSYGAPAGLAELHRACARSKLPVYALGGMTAGRVAEIKPTGAAGFACIRAVLAAPSPGTTVKEMLANWQA